MTNWRFNLRSGLDSDEDDVNENPAQASSENTGPGPRNHDTNDDPSSHRVLVGTANEDSTSKKLQELFGTAEEEKVSYKPNPWSIAKINANARATTERPAIRKPTFKSPWPTKLVKQSTHGQVIIPGFTKPGPFTSKSPALRSPNDSSAGPRRPNASSRSLRDSISAALRRDPDIALATDNPTANNQNVAIIPKNPIPSGSYNPETNISLPLSGLYNLGDPSPETPTVYQKYSAYIPEHETIITQNSPTVFPQAQSAAAYPPVLDADASESHTPALTWGHPSSDGLVSPIEGYYPPTDLQVTLSGTGLRYEHEGSRHDYAALPSPLMDPPSPELNPQHLPGTLVSPCFQGELEHNYGDNYASGRVNVASPTMLESSPTLQLMAEYAVKPPPQTNYTAKSRANEYSQNANTRGASPTFAYAAPSPTRETFLPGASHTPTPAHKRNRVRESDFSDEVIIPAIRREPITPLQPSRKYATKSGPWLDPDEEPVWSTLPSRSRKTKQVKTPVATSRFRLPGTFLGSSSPLGEQESKRLYKPPPRKRSLEQNEDRGRWKVTRIA
ncbi:hypothetical protein FRC10_006991 [Ceratobasidium sp. 414]|nr:hypothetical protein FRC10_006991 [Ceratobasidium sp. 414]